MSDRIARLPKWAQRHIEGLERRIDDGGEIDIRPGMVHSFVPTRKELASMKAARDREVFTIVTSEWRRILAGIK